MPNKNNNIKNYSKKFIICPNCKGKNLIFKKKSILCKYCKEIYPLIFDIPILITRKKCKELKLDYHKKNFEKEILRSNNFKLNKFGILKYVEKILMGTSGILYKDINNLKKYPIANIPFNKQTSKKLFFLDVGCGWEDGQLMLHKKTLSVLGLMYLFTRLLQQKKYAIN